jgi:hypothetical protein
MTQNITLDFTVMTDPMISAVIKFIYSHIDYAELESYLSQWDPTYTTYTFYLGIADSVPISTINDILALQLEDLGDLVTDKVSFLADGVEEVTITWEPAVPTETSVTVDMNGSTQIITTVDPLVIKSLVGGRITIQATDKYAKPVILDAIPVPIYTP